MKHIRAGLALMILLCAAMGAGAQAKQATRDSLPYQKNPTLPAFYLLSPDSSKTFNTYDIPEGRPTVLFFFSPDCEHCQITTKAMLEKMDSMKTADFYMFTFQPLTMLRPFIKEYGLNRYKNIIVAKDYQYFFPMYYGAKTVPYLVVYDRHKKLVKLWDGTVKMPELIRLLQSL